MKNKKIILLIVSIITLMLLFSFIGNRKNENTKIVVKEAFSDNEATRNDAKDKLALLAKEGDPTAQYRYGEILYRENDMENSRYFLELASKAGVLKSTELLGMLYLESKNIEDRLNGFNLLNNIAEKGLSSSQFYLGVCFIDGECSFPKNDYLTFYWLTLAVKNGESDAKFSLEIGDIKEVKISSKRTKAETQKVICGIAPLSQSCNQ